MSEQVYDEIVAPMLLEVLKVCHEHGMPITATVEYATGEYGTSADFPADRSLPVDWAYVAARSNGNADVLIGHLVSQAEARGHGSVYLKQLGVPTVPARKGE